MADVMVVVMAMVVAMVMRGRERRDGEGRQQRRDEQGLGEFHGSLLR